MRSPYAGAERRKYSSEEGACRCQARPHSTFSSPLVPCLPSVFILEDLKEILFPYLKLVQMSIKCVFVKVLTFSPRSLSEQLLHEAPSEKFTERRVHLLKSQIIQLERQVCVTLYILTHTC